MTKRNSKGKSLKYNRNICLFDNECQKYKRS